MGKTCGSSEVDVCLFLGSVCLYFLIFREISLHLKILCFVGLSTDLGQNFFRLVQEGHRGKDRMGFPLVAHFVSVGLCSMELGFFSGFTRRGLRLALSE